MRILSYLLALTIFGPISLADDKDSNSKLEAVKVQKLVKGTWTRSKFYPVWFTAQRQHQIIAPANGYFISQVMQPGQEVKAKGLLGTLRNDEPGFSPHPIGLISPAHGTLSRVHVPLGAFVRKNDVVFTVLDLSSTIASIQIPQIDLNFIKVGLKGEISVRGRDNFPAEISAVSPSIDSAAGTAMAFLKYSSKISILPGSLGQVRMDLTPEQGFVLSRDAIRQLGAKAYVMLIKNAKAFNHQIEVSEQRQDEVLVKVGLNEGDLFCKKYPLQVKDGQDVKVEE